MSQIKKKASFSPASLQSKNSSTRPAVNKMGVITGLAALSLDAVSSVAYGPEEVVRSLTEGNAPAQMTLIVTAALVLLLAILIISYRQVIEVFPDGGGSYAVAKKYFGRLPSLVAASSLIIDYVLNVPVAISAGVAAAWSAFPVLSPYGVMVALVFLTAIMAINLRGIVAGAKVFIAPTVLFLGAMICVGVVGLFKPSISHHQVAQTASTIHAVGLLVMLKAFANGCSALTGVEAIANAVPEFREPTVKNASRVEFALGGLLAALLFTIAHYISKFDITPRPDKTVLSQIVSYTLGDGFSHYLFQVITVIMLFLAANTSFGGLPHLMNLLAEDDYLPHRLAARTKAGVYREGVIFLALAAGVLLIIFRAKVEELVPLYSIGVFIGFSIAQSGLVVHWWREKPTAWQLKLGINAVGALTTTSAAVVVFSVKFAQNAWLIFVVMACLIYGMHRVNGKYYQQDEFLHDADSLTSPLPEVQKPVIVLIPVASVSILARRALIAASYLGGSSIAVHVATPYETPDTFEQAWDTVFPDTELVFIDPHENNNRAAALTEYVQSMEQYYQVIVVLADSTPPKRWRALLPSLNVDQFTKSLNDNTNAIIAHINVQNLDLETEEPATI